MIDRSLRWQKRPQHRRIYIYIYIYIFLIPFIIFAHLLLLSLLPTRNSDPGSHRKLFYPLPATVHTQVWPWQNIIASFFLLSCLYISVQRDSFPIIPSAVSSIFVIIPCTTATVWRIIWTLCLLVITNVIYTSGCDLKNRHGHWLCWMSTGRNNGWMWRTHTERPVQVYPLSVDRQAHGRFRFRCDTNEERAV